MSAKMVLVPLILVLVPFHRQQKPSIRLLLGSVVFSIGWCNVRRLFMVKYLFRCPVCSCHLFFSSMVLHNLLVKTLEKICLPLYAIISLRIWGDNSFTLLVPFLMNYFHYCFTIQESSFGVRIVKINEWMCSEPLFLRISNHLLIYHFLLRLFFRFTSLKAKITSCIVAFGADIFTNGTEMLTCILRVQCFVKFLNDFYQFISACNNFPFISFNITLFA